MRGSFEIGKISLAEVFAGILEWASATTYQYPLLLPR